MKLDVLSPESLSPKETKDLRSLSMRSKGELSENISYFRYYPNRRAKVIRLCDDDGRVLSWGMVFPYPGRSDLDFQVYTRTSERGKGYGKMVYDKAVRIARGRHNLLVHPHSIASTNFFNDFHYGPAGLPLEPILDEWVK